MFIFNRPWETVLFEGEETGGGGAGNETNVEPVGMDVVRASTLNGLDESYHDDWNQMVSRVQTPSDIAKNYVEAQRAARSAITVPGDDAKPEQWDDVFNKLGRPAEAKDYSFRDTFGEGDNTYALTDEDKAFREAFRPVAHRARLTQAQVAEMENFQFENNQVMADARDARAGDITDKSRQVLERQYGPDFEANKQNMLVSSKHYAGQDWDDLTSIKLEDGTFLLDHPIWFRMHSKIGAERSEDFREANPLNESGRADAKVQYEKIRQEAIDKGLLPSNPKWPTDELQRLSDRIHGKASAISGGSVSNARALSLE